MDAAYTASDVTGRLRVKIPARKSDAGFFEDIARALGKMEGIRRVEANPLTASVLIIHSATTAGIMGAAAAAGLFEAGEEAGRPVLAERITRSFNSFDRGVRRLTSGELDIPSLAFLALLGLAIYQIASGNFMAPAWYTLAWYALNIFLKGLPGGSTTPA